MPLLFLPICTFSFILLSSSFIYEVQSYLANNLLKTVAFKEVWSSEGITKVNVMRDNRHLEKLDSYGRGDLDSVSLQVNHYPGAYPHLHMA